MIEFTIPGRIRGKGRIRHFGKQHFMDAKTRSDEALIRHFASQAMKGRAPFEGPVYLRISIQLQPPKSWSEKKRRTTLYVTSKPDLDNIIKLIGDALNGIVFQDDSQISELHIARLYDAEAAEAVLIICRRIGQTISEARAA